ncbi:MAG: hypothetical protein JNK15_12780 [Planctomycetes bacterium]|nr:hypothetical protein [Planctomycetota bacterium]
MAPSRIVVIVGIATFVIPSIAPAQGTRWSIPPHGAVLYTQTGSFTGTTRAGRRFSVLDSVSSTCQPVLFADELLDEGRRWLAEPYSLVSVPVWLAMDLTTLDKPGPVRHVWPRLLGHGEVTFTGSADKPDPDGWQRITGRLTRVPVREQPGRPKRELDIDHWYLACDLDATLELRRRFEPDTTQQDRYGRRGIVSSIEWQFGGRLEAGNPRESMELSGKRTWQLVGVRDNRHAASVQGPGFLAEQQLESSAVVERELGMLRDMKGTVADGERQGAIHGPSLHAFDLYGIARAGLRVDTAAVAEQLASLLTRQQTEPHGLAFTILAIAGLHAPADERIALLQGRATRIQLPLPMRRVVEQHVAALLHLRHTNPGGSGHWSARNDANNRSVFHSGVVVQALDIATRCGVRVPADVFESHARDLVGTALDCVGAKPATLQLEAGITRAAAASDRRPSTTASTPSCGWTDSDLGAFAVDGSDTAMAMATLLTCNRHVRDAGLRAQALQCVERGWAWLGDHFTARHAPSRMHVHRQHRGEFVLAMAWLIDETGVRWVNGRDVWFELSTVLLVETEKGLVPTTVADPAAAQALWRPFAMPGPTVTPGR